MPVLCTITTTTTMMMTMMTMMAMMTATTTVTISEPPLPTAPVPWVTPGRASTAVTLVLGAFAALGGLLWLLVGEEGQADLKEEADLVLARVREFFGLGAWL